TVVRPMVAPSVAVADKPAPSATASTPAPAPTAAPTVFKVNVERIAGFDGPVELSIEGLPAGISTAKTSVAARQASADVEFTAAYSAKIGATRVRIVGSAEVGG